MAQQGIVIVANLLRLLLDFRFPGFGPPHELVIECPPTAAAAAMPLKHAELRLTGELKQQAVLGVNQQHLLQATSGTGCCLIHSGA